MKESEQQFLTKIERKPSEVLIRYRRLLLEKMHRKIELKYISHQAYRDDLMPGALRLGTVLMTLENRGYSTKI